MVEVDPEKVRSLQLKWIQFEHWWQQSRSDPDAAPRDFPGYTMISRHGSDAWSFYRDWLLVVFAELRGVGALYEEAVQLVDVCRSTNPAGFAEFVQAHSSVPADFHVQWNNLFYDTSWGELDHNTVNVYVRKYEVEWPLVFWAQLVEVGLGKPFDHTLERFRDRSGNLRKGGLAQHVKRSLSGYETLQKAWSHGYVPKLRNAIGHNRYSIDNGRFKALDSDIDENSAEFFSHLASLQEFQNCALWIVNRLSVDTSTLRAKGVVSGGWVIGGRTDDPDLMLFQLQPFYYLDPQASWLSDIELRVEGAHLTTRYGGDFPIEGPIDPEMRPLLEQIRADGSLQCQVFAVMPCIHDGEHPTYEWPDGTFCLTAKVVEKSLVVDWS